MNAETLARALGGRRAGSAWMAPCPAHDDRDPSLSITDADDGRLLLHCHAGCEQAAVIAELRARGLWETRPGVARVEGEGRSSDAPQPPRGQTERDRTAMALRIWQAADPAGETAVEVYLRSRGLSVASPALRHHPRLKHPSGGAWPAMVALVTRGTDAEPLAVHRTFLARDGAGKAPVTPQKMMLGPCRGGAVRLAPASGQLLVGEGIETCLAVMQATGIPAWAALSASGLRALSLPADVRDVVVLADGDDAGEAAAVHAARRWKRDGRNVRIARPPRGLDFNDLLLGHHVIKREDVA